MKSVKIRIKRAVRELLTEQAARCETAAFMQGDPSWYMHQVQGQPGQEVMAFIAASLSYGSRAAFMPKLQHLLDSMQGDPLEWVGSGAFASTVPDDEARSFYRLQTYHHMHAMLRGLQAMLEGWGTIGGYVQSSGATTALQAIEAITRYFATFDTGHLLPRDATSACKRLCMLLRWMVRDGSPVDLGLWSSFIDKANLYVPLDIHVLQTANQLEIARVKSAGWKAVVDLTRQLGEAFPGDPARGDFALYGYDIDR